MKKELSQKEILNFLKSTQSPLRRRAAKLIGKLRISKFGKELFEAYLREREDKRTWETQMEMIKSLGLIGFKPALKIVEQICKINNPHDAITSAAAETYVRLKRKSLSDATPILELLEFGKLSVAHGAVDPLGYDRMTPSKDQVLKLIKLCWNLGKNKGTGYGDPRYGIAAACAGWDKELTTPFLEHCLKTAGRETGLEYVAKNSLKGKYVKLR